jgi:hypothetical protein
MPSCTCDGVGRSFEKVLAARGTARPRTGWWRGGALKLLRRSPAIAGAAVGQRHHILGTQAHGLGNRGLIDVFAHDQHRHSGRALLLDLHERSQVDAEFLDESHQQFGVQLGERIPEIAGVRQPCAMHRMAGLAQRAVDRFDVVLRPGHDDHWNGPLFGHGLESSRKRSKV